jgi:hypothetical protein
MAIAAAPAAALAQSPPARPAADAAVSTGRVSRALRQAPIQIPPLPALDHPTFRVEVTTQPGLETALDAVRRELAADPLGHSDIPQARMVKVNVLPALTGLARRVQKARRARAERRIHAEVTAELAAFCAVNDCAAANEGLLLPQDK